MANDPRLAIESIPGRRPYQEDAVLAEELPDGRVLVAVADGMGGHAAGEVASALALETLAQALRDGGTLEEAFSLANARVHEKAREPGKHGMGTTLVAALVADGKVEWANVGDSRGYVISGEGIRQLTNDHSFVAEAVKRGQSEAEALAGPWRDALTRSIGTEEDVEVDTFGPMDVTANSALLVCSDGLYKTLPDGELLSIYARSGGARGAAQSLVSSAFENGSDDNISVAIAEYGEVRSTAAGGTMPLDHAPPAGDLGEAEAGAAELPEAEGAGGEPAADVAAEGDERPVAAAGVGSLPVGALVAAVVVIGALLGLLVLR